MTARVLLYGATGYTGRLTAETAREGGHRPILAGRDAGALEELSRRLDLDWRAFTLDDPGAIGGALEGVDAVLHMAGPFSGTFAPMLEACLRTRTHYLDITGEVDVIEAIAARGDEARDRGVVLMPAVGFDVVPSDCLAVHVAAAVPEPTNLDLGILAYASSPSPGTSKTMIEGVSSGLPVRRDGEVVELPQGSLSRRFDFGRGPRHSVALSWGDVATAYHSTGIPNVTVYFAAGRGMRWLARVSRYVGPLGSLQPVQAGLKRLVDIAVQGPGEERRVRGGHVIVADVRNGRGDQAVSRLQTPEGYTLTSRTAMEAARRVAAGEVETGFRTPGGAFGPDFILGFDGVSREDVVRPKAADQPPGPPPGSP